MCRASMWHRAAVILSETKLLDFEQDQPLIYDDLSEDISSFIFVERTKKQEMARYDPNRSSSSHLH